jgi:type III secretion system FlhB-like substrate exporter
MTNAKKVGVPAPRDDGPAGVSPGMQEWAEQLVARAREEGVSLTGEGGLLTAMVRQVLQTGLGLDPLSWTPDSGA